MTSVQKSVLEAMLNRVEEMRANMEEFASDLEKAGVKGLSFERWRAELDEKERSIQERLDRIG